jgi:hypothetical protein
MPELLIVRSFRQKIWQRVTTLHGDDDNIMSTFLWIENVGKWPRPLATVKEYHILYPFLVKKFYKIHEFDQKPQIL